MKIAGSMDYYSSRRHVICSNGRRVLAQFSASDFGCGATGQILDLESPSRKMYRKFAIDDLGCSTFILPNPPCVRANGLGPSARHHALVALTRAIQRGPRHLLQLLRSVSDSELLWLFAVDPDELFEGMEKPQTSCIWRVSDASSPSTSTTVASYRALPVLPTHVLSRDRSSATTFYKFLARKFLAAFTETFTMCISLFNEDWREGVAALEKLGAISHYNNHEVAEEHSRIFPSSQYSYCDCSTSDPTGSGLLTSDTAAVSHSTEDRIRRSAEDQIEPRRLKLTPIRKAASLHARRIVDPLPEVPRSFQIAFFMLATPGVYPSAISTCCVADQLVLQHFTNLFEFTGLDLSTALRFFTSHYMLNGESQEVYAAVESFSRSYCTTSIKSGLFKANSRHKLNGKIDFQMILEMAVYQACSEDDNHRRVHNSASGIFKWARKLKIPPKELRIGRAAADDDEDNSPTRQAVRHKRAFFDFSEFDKLEEAVLTMAYGLLMCQTSKKVKAIEGLEFKNMMRSANIELADHYLDGLYTSVHESPLQFQMDLNIDLSNGEFANGYHHLSKTVKSHCGAHRPSVCAEEAKRYAVSCYRQKDHRYQQKRMLWIDSVYINYNHRHYNLVEPDRGSESKDRMRLTRLSNFALLGYERMKKIISVAPMRLGTVPRGTTAVLQLIRDDYTDEIFFIEDRGNQTHNIVRTCERLAYQVRENRRTPPPARWSIQGVPISSDYAMYSMSVRARLGAVPNSFSSRFLEGLSQKLAQSQITGQSSPKLRALINLGLVDVAKRTRLGLLMLLPTGSVQRENPLLLHYLDLGRCCLVGSIELLNRDLGLVRTSIAVREQDGLTEVKVSGAEGEIRGVPALHSAAIFLATLADERQTAFSSPTLADLYIATWLMATLDPSRPEDLLEAVEFMTVQKQYKAELPWNANIGQILPQRYPVTVATWAALNVDYQLLLQSWGDRWLLGVAPFAEIKNLWENLFINSVSLKDLVLKKLLKASSFNDSFAIPFFNLIAT